MASKKLKIEVTENELMSWNEAVESLKAMKGAMSEDFNEECDWIGKCFNSVLKRNGLKIENDYSSDNIKV